MSWWRKVLNLPEKKSKGGDDFTDALASRSERAQGTPSNPTSTPPAPNAGWAEEADGSRAVRWGLRTAVYCVLALMTALGVRSIVFPPGQESPRQQRDPQAQARKDDVPEEAAQQVAARFARSYLTWSHNDSKVRDSELAADLPKGADAKAGWDGNGTQLVAQTIPGRVTQTRPHQARVSVDVRVSAVTGTGARARTVSSWRGLEVPVAESGGRVLVTGQPALVGVQQPVEWTEPEPPDTDAGLGQSTRGAVEAFFKVWAAGTADQATAPGARIAPLGDGMSLHSVDAWTVETGSGARRSGIASVRWRLAGAVLQQSYRVTITQVSAGGVSRWQVWKVTSQ
ncbi:conjugal transfer protein [Streptomyces sp. NPDC050204]|uniref:conjugal transfer protein n=1 Tax=Streptomyces sp. NPDC050204 TaxID=3155514 RepID=UPI003439B6C1